MICHIFRNESTQSFHVHTNAITRLQEQLKTRPHSFARNRKTRNVSIKYVGEENRTRYTPSIEGTLGIAILAVVSLVAFKACIACTMNMRGAQRAQAR